MTNISNKTELLNELRSFAEQECSKFTQTDVKNNTKNFNIIMKNKENGLIKEFLSEKTHTKQFVINTILLVNYCINIVMLEFRNKLWNYEYMAFSRRIGEIWEPFCKLVFEYPMIDLQIIHPPKFSDIIGKIKTHNFDFISSLDINEDQKSYLMNIYNKLILLVESGEINLNLDLHFSQNKSRYHIDFKSGFSSNEKGNTNRLLLVASVYQLISASENLIIFVRQQEKDNNHYLQTLKQSKKWQIYCANDVYDKIHEFTGVNLKKWINDNMNWEEDISLPFKDYLVKHSLLKYLTW